MELNESDDDEPCNCQYSCSVVAEAAASADKEEEHALSRHAFMLTVYVVPDFSPVSVVLVLDEVVLAETVVDCRPSVAVSS